MFIRNEIVGTAAFLYEMVRQRASKTELKNDDAANQLPKVLGQLARIKKQEMKDLEATQWLGYSLSFFHRHGFLEAKDVHEYLNEWSPSVVAGSSRRIGCYHYTRTYFLDLIISAEEAEKIETSFSDLYIQTINSIANMPEKSFKASLLIGYLLGELQWHHLTSEEEAETHIRMDIKALLN
jgi:hypothetical protein